MLKRSHGRLGHQTVAAYVRLRTFDVDSDFSEDPRVIDFGSDNLRIV
jgi:hypothetical protein